MPLLRSGWYKNFWYNFLTSGLNSNSVAEIDRQIVFTNSFSIIGISCVFSFGFLHFYLGNQLAGWFEIGGGCLAVVNLVYLRISKNGAVASSCLLALMLPTLLFLFINGGVENTGIVWFFTFPILAFFLKGIREGFLWSLHLIAWTIVAVLFGKIGIISVPFSWVIIRQTLFSLGAVIFLIYLYENERMYLKQIDNQKELDLAALNNRLQNELGRNKKSKIAVSLLEAIVSSAYDAIYSKDLNGIVTSWNKGAENLYGYTAAEMVGSSVEKVIPSDRKKELEFFLKKISTGETIEQHHTIRKRKDGTIVHVSLTLAPIKDSSGTIMGAAVVARDVTRDEEKEANLEERNQELARLNKLMVGRELKMVALKEEIQQLQNKVVLSNK